MGTENIFSETFMPEGHRGGKRNEESISNEDEEASGNVKSDDIFKLIDLYFSQPNILYSHQIASFDKFLDEDVHNILTKSENIFFEKITKDKKYKHRFVFDNIAIRQPIIENEDEYMFPIDARLNDMTYAVKLLADVVQVVDITDIATGETTTKTVGEKEKNVQVANIPIMVRSKYCNLNQRKDSEKAKKESEFDPGGYFIVNGNEKVVISLEKMGENKMLAFIKRDPTGKIYTVQVNSKNHNTNDPMQTVSFRMKKDYKLMVRIPLFNEFPAYILFRALGIESDRDIINYIVFDETDTEMINLVRISLEKSRDESKGGRYANISTQEEAYEYLMTKMRVAKRYSETDATLRDEERKMHLRSILENIFLPHVTGKPIYKGYYSCLMVNKLFKCFLGRIEPDDRDSFVNKRVETPGVLIGSLFKQDFKKLLNECNKHFRQKLTNDEDPANIINHIKPTTIEQGIKKALSTGSWGARNKKGVAQVLQRLSFLQTVSYLRRINSPTADASTNKLTGPRHLHNTQWFYACCLTGDTEILMGGGVMTKPIKDIKETDTVTTVNPETLKEEITKIKNYFKVMPEKLLEIETLSGRKIKCTPDHPILTIKNNKYVWKNSEELNEGDAILIRHTQKYIKDEQLQEKRKLLETFQNKYGADLEVNGTKISLKPSSIKNKSNETLQFMKNISNMFSELKIKTFVEEQNDKINLRFDQSIKNLERYVTYMDCTTQQKSVIEYIKYCNKTKNKRISFQEFEDLCLQKSDKIAIPILSIKEIKPELVYDFETISSNHSLISDSVITHNCVESPEGHNVGLVKNMALSANITHLLLSHVYIIKEMLQPRLKDLRDLHPSEFKRLTKVFLNGEPLGMEDNPVELTKLLQSKKTSGELDKSISITYDPKQREIRIWCDGGRLYRPVLKTDGENNLNIKPEHLEAISLNRIPEKGKINKWADYLAQYPEDVTYLDTEETEFSLIAMYPEVVAREKKKMDYVPNDEDIENSKINRYGSLVFRKYTHCELHPSLMIGVVASNIPLCNHNQAPRNVFQYSQARQTMGIYISNYLDRLDISYVLYYPQRPVIVTRAMQWIKTMQQPAGENSVVAIATYSGLSPC
jgi:DNA-directed RNA polymerase beta subunit